MFSPSGEVRMSTCACLSPVLHVHAKTHPPVGGLLALPGGTHADDNPLASTCILSQPRPSRAPHTHLELACMPGTVHPLHTLSCVVARASCAAVSSLLAATRRLTPATCCRAADTCRRQQGQQQPAATRESGRPQGWGAGLGRHAGVRMQCKCGRQPASSLGSANTHSAQCIRTLAHARPGLLSPPLPFCPLPSPPVLSPPLPSASSRPAPTSAASCALSWSSRATSSTSRRWSACTTTHHQATPQRMQHPTRHVIYSP